MYKLFIIILFFSFKHYGQAQILVVDVVKGKADAKGSFDEPLSNLEQAVTLANKFYGDKPVTIKLAPGLYTLGHRLKITSENGSDTSMYSIEAMVMPDDADWTPSKMPVIQILADSNREGKLPHASVALQIERNNVSIKGLKFLGNPNPASEYFYAIERRNKALKNLEVSQCYFIGDKNSAPIQGGVFAQGESIHINYCIFYNCKNAVLCFLNIKDFSITHSIIYGAYEAAIWFGYGIDANLPFTFHDNVIANGNYFWIGDKGMHSNYSFSNSVISGNTNYMGFNGDIIEPDTLNKPTEKNIQKSGKVFLSEITAKGIPRDYLNLSDASAGKNIDAGIFVNPKNR